MTNDEGNPLHMQSDSNTQNVHETRGSTGAADTESSENAKNVNDAKGESPVTSAQESALKEADASFNATFKSLSALLSAKKQKYSALKTLALAEAELSVNALIILLLGGIALFGIALTLWLLINLLIGLTVYQIISSLFLVTFFLIAMNIASVILIGKYLKNTRAAVGFSKTINSVKGEV